MLDTSCPRAFESWDTKQEAVELMRKEASLEFRIVRLESISITLLSMRQSTPLRLVILLSLYGRLLHQSSQSASISCPSLTRSSLCRNTPGVGPKIDALRRLYEGKKIIVGRDKLDPTKGVLPKVRLLASLALHPIPYLLAPSHVLKRTLCTATSL